MALTANVVSDLVNVEIGNLTYKGAATATGDGSADSYHIAPEGYYVVSGTLVVTVAGAATTAFTADYDSGNLVFDSPPADDAAIVFTFDYTPFHADAVSAAVTAAVDALFPYFYKYDTENLTPDGETYEFALGQGEIVQSVYHSSTSAEPWLKQKRTRYDIYDHGTTKYLRFYSAPSAGTLRVHTVARCAIGDLPDRAKAPLVSYACYYLITQKMAPRVRADVAVVTQGTGTLSPRQMNDAAQAFFLRYQVQVSANKMQPWRTS